MFSKISDFFKSLVNNPVRVFIYGAVLTFLTLTFDGSLWRFWSLNRGQEQMQSRLDQLEERARNLEFKIHQAESLTFIERQATDQFDYVREGDLIFIFSD